MDDTKQRALNPEEPTLQCANCGRDIQHDEPYIYVRYRREDPTQPPEKLITGRGERTYCLNCTPVGIPHR